MLTQGYMGDILRIDQYTRKVSVTTLEEELVRKYIGGSGLRAKILFDDTSADTGPLSAGRSSAIGENDSN